VKKQRDLGCHLRSFLGEYLPKQRNASPGTVRAYRDALKLLLCFVASLRNCAVADLSISDVDRAAVLAFLESIEVQRGNIVTTRNHRLAAIRSFFRFVSFNVTEVVEQCTQILAIPLKRGESRAIDYLTVDEIEAVLRQIPTDTVEGRRHDVLLRFLYNTGARVQEAIDARANDLQLDSPAHVLLRGKGRKERLCPLWPDTSKRLRRWLAECSIAVAHPVHVFTNRKKEPLTRSGVRYILSKYVSKATAQCPSLRRKNVHPHTMRHTTAMHLLQSNVDINTIRCWLGHASITTTNRYVEIDLEMKRRALEGVSSPLGASTSVKTDDTLLAWLESL
jgi:integrase/recombinase XerC